MFLGLERYICCTLTTGADLLDDPVVETIVPPVSATCV